MEIGRGRDAYGGRRAGSDAALLVSVSDGDWKRSRPPGGNRAVGTFAVSFQSPMEIGRGRDEYGRILASHDEIVFQSPMEIGRGRDMVVVTLFLSLLTVFQSPMEIGRGRDKFAFARVLDLTEDRFSLRWRLEEVATSPQTSRRGVFGRQFQSPMEIGRGRDRVPRNLGGQQAH